MKDHERVLFHRGSLCVPVIRFADRCTVEERILFHSVYEMRVYEKVRLLNRNRGEEKLTIMSA